jgi:ABC-2 type transport system ATP-binding protein
MNAIEIHELTRTFGERVAVDRLTLDIPVGAVFGFLRPNGAGKTTTVRMLTALIAPTSGAARVHDHALGPVNELIRRSVGILTETPGLYERLSARHHSGWVPGHRACQRVADPSQPRSGPAAPRAR